MYTHRYVLRAVIEFTTPFLVASGRGEEISDDEFVSDANGLPMIPGSSIAGVLRSAFSDKRAADQLFGFQKGNDGQGSRISVSSACIHDSKNRPVEALAAPERLVDSVLANACDIELRDHVRINHRGASDADNYGKFDERAVCAGHRFTFEVGLSGDESDSDLWNLLLQTIQSNPLKFGGKTRRGYGSFRFISIKSRVFDLRMDFDSYQKHPVRLETESAVLSDEIPPDQSQYGSSICLKLKACNYWMFGGGDDVSGREKPADMTPVRGSRVIWSSGIGSVKKDIAVIPGSGIKGALAHRTAFHHNAQSGIFADKLSGEGDLLLHVGESNIAVRELFGFCKGAVDDAPEGMRGRIMIDDVYPDVEPESKLIQHVGLDRFTGGSRDQVLFNEAPFYSGDFTVTIHISEIDEISEAALKAFVSALKDLCEGRLQVGAGSGRGIGYFTGKFTELPYRIKEALK